MEIIKASIGDSQEILALQKRAYQSEAVRYNNYQIPPLTQTLAELQGQFPTHLILKAVDQGKIIGTVRAYQKDDTCYIGRLAVDPERQNQGLGTALMREVEKYYSPKRFELFVGAKSEKNIHLYQKLGYHTFRAGCECGQDIEIFYMEKLV